MRCLLLFLLFVVSACNSNSQDSPGKSTSDTMTQVTDKNKVLPKGTYIDLRDSQTYKWVTLQDGNIWMAQNLNYESEGSFCYYDNPDNCQNWGRLYRFEAALKACPEGWHLPSREEWNQMLSVYGEPTNFFNHNMNFEASKKAYTALKVGGEAGLDLTISGLQMMHGYMSKEDKLETGLYWSASRKDDNHASYYQINKKSERITHWDQFKLESSAMSCRCVKNKE